jgi:peptide/nickel transport system ATP-binding protein
MSEPVADVRDLVVGPAAGGDPVVDGVSFTLPAGRVLGLVGRSGSGKTAVAHALLGHLRPGLAVRGGAVRVAGLDPFTAAGALRGRVVSYLGQDPAAALNPARRIGAQLAEAVRLRAGIGRSGVDDRVAALLASVRLPADRAFLRRFSHQVSGGQAQRVGLAMALAGAPKLIVLDEPTSGLDTVVAAEVRGLLAELLGGAGPAAVLVSHDHAVVAELTDEVLVLGETPRPARVLRTPEPARPGPVRLAVESLSARHGRLAVVRDVSLDIPAGTALALVGPSGSGKTTISRAVVGLHPRSAGAIRLDGETLAPHFGKRGPDARRAIQFVAQDSVGALNPRETVRTALLRALRGRPDARRELTRLLERVHLPAAVADRRPGELSGGERQRVNLCRALAAGPRVLVCDEVTSALDTETAAAVLDLLAELRTGLGLAVLLVTHDLAVAAEAAQRIAVLDAGRIVETGPTGAILRSPAHELTRALRAAG